MKKVEALNDGLFRLLGLPIITLAGNILFYNSENQENGIPFLTAYLHGLVTALLTWELGRQVLMFVRRRYPGISDVRNRILFTAVGYVVTSVVVVFPICYYYDVTEFWGYPFTPAKYAYNILIIAFLSFVIGSVYEGIYYFRSWNQVTLEAETLKKEQLQTQLDSLKAQINPHFLFNSLSALQSLIEEDPVKAEAFVGEMSEVYRYVLQSNEKQLTTLSEELQFMQSYIHLLHTRFGDGLQVHIEAEQGDLVKQIPPLTLQLLVENAVKHNIVQPDHPLHVRIRSAGDGYLEVQNNLQRKPTKVSSTGTGLRNIVAKYELMGQPEVRIIDDRQHFSVFIPLIA